MYFSGTPCLSFSASYTCLFPVIGPPNIDAHTCPTELTLIHGSARLPEIYFTANLALNWTPSPLQRFISLIPELQLVDRAGHAAQSSLQLPSMVWWSALPFVAWIFMLDHMWMASCHPGLLDRFIIDVRTQWHSLTFEQNASLPNAHLSSEQILQVWTFYVILSHLRKTARLVRSMLRR